MQVSALLQRIVTCPRMNWQTDWKSLVATERSRIWIRSLAKKLTEFFDGMRQGCLCCGACVIINIGSRDGYNRFYCDNRFLSADGDMSVYHFVRLVTGDDSFTKEYIERKNHD